MDNDDKERMKMRRDLNLMVHLWFGILAIGSAIVLFGIIYDILFKH